MLTKNQKGYIKHWTVIIFIAICLLFASRGYLSIAYSIAAALFFIGLSLRLLNLYPGKREPLILDLSAVLIAALLVVISDKAGGSVNIAILISMSPVIILPHIFYIVLKKDI